MRVVPVVAIAAVLGAGIAGVFASSADTPRALAISRDRDRLELRVADATANPEEMTRELREIGIQAQVEAVPVPPTHVGTWIVLAEAPAALCGRRRAPQGGRRQPIRAIHRNAAVLALSVARLRRSGGCLLFVAGRPVREGEPALDVQSPQTVDRSIAPFVQSASPITVQPSPGSADSFDPPPVERSPSVSADRSAPPPTERSPSGSTMPSDPKPSG